MKRVFQNHKDSSKWVTKTQDTCLPSPFSLIQTLQRQTVFQSKSIKDKLSNQNNQELVSEDSVHTLHWYVSHPSNKFFVCCSITQWKNRSQNVPGRTEKQCCLVKSSQFIYLCLLAELWRLSLN